MIDDIFWEIHSDLPREGPGDDESTRRAFKAMTDLPASPRILDVACGPGMQTMELSRLSNGPITAVDTHESFLAELRRRVDAAGISGRVSAMNASMFDMPFADGSFDIIWCEGAMYIMGIPAAVSAWRRLLPSGGYIAFTEPCFLRDQVPEEVKSAWMNDYPAMTTEGNTKRIIAENGYDVVESFTIPESAWWDNYYTPQERRLEMLREKYKDDADKLERLAQNQKEIDDHRLYHEYYGYQFFVIRKGTD
jgi:ubiquinone/menaquinone biosynthesis C-methylase UbiE